MKKLALTVLLVGCKWTQFDDLETESWVHSTTKPDSNSSDWGIALARGGKVTDPAAADRLVVLGVGQALYSELNYKPDGSADLATTEIKLNNQFAISNLDTQPILVPDPATDDVSLVVNSGGGSIAILAGTHNLTARQIFNPKNPSPDAATYMMAPLTGGPSSQLLVASVDTVYGSVSTNPPMIQPTCALVESDGTTPVMIRAIGAAQTVAGQTTDTVVVWSATGKLLLYPSGVFTADALDCPAGIAMPVTGSAAVDTAFLPAKGSQLTILDHRFAILAGHHDADDVSSVQMWDLQAGAGLLPTMVGSPVTQAGLKSSAILDLDAAHRWVILGYPSAVLDGTAAGQVVLHAITASGIENAAAEQLSDAQPESNQLFGRAVAAFRFNGHPIIAVGADNEVFAYYRSTLYDDTRAP